jgi:hypothetical protein
MSSDAYCLVGIALSLATLVFIAVILWKMPRPVIFSTWRDIRAASRQSRTTFDKFLLALIIYRQISRGAAIFLTLGFISAATTIGTSICGVSPETLRGIRDIVNDILRWLRPDNKATSCTKGFAALS